MDRNGLESRSWKLPLPSLVAANKPWLSTVINAIRIIDRLTEYGRYRGVMALLRRHDGNDVRWRAAIRRGREGGGAQRFLRVKSGSRYRSQRSWHTELSSSPSSREEWRAIKPRRFLLRGGKQPRRGRMHLRRETPIIISNYIRIDSSATKNQRKIPSPE